MSQPTETQHCRGCSCHDAPQAAQDTQQLVDLIKSAHSATAALAEVVRAQSQALVAVVERNNPQPNPATPIMAQPDTKPVDGMVISERIGSISVAQWDEMSDDQLRTLDQILEGVANMILLENIGSMNIARAVRTDLASMGLVFKNLSECLPLNRPRDWALARDRSLPELVRMRAVASASRPTKDGSEWWIDEMMRVVVRLMELRGT